ncbi:hypothetical protein BS50DRAFT_381844 [Corynespora cassiicola Philippines]|uniref:Uncharacterized protein n=1 Tax=Corynespora cassiicola Philippines TaxID=1448308 RepID=A0A2T2NPU9_CORCC|nr:hypothetical protein BS50DRAFT_381844 [Corynespora cassiicola Philippines]
MGQPQVVQRMRQGSKETVESGAGRRGSLTRAGRLRRVVQSLLGRWPAGRQSCDAVREHHGAAQGLQRWQGLQDSHGSGRADSDGGSRGQSRRRPRWRPRGLWGGWARWCEEPCRVGLDSARHRADDVGVDQTFAARRGCEGVYRQLESGRAVAGQAAMVLQEASSAV